MGLRSYKCCNKDQVLDGVVLRGCRQHSGYQPKSMARLFPINKQNLLYESSVGYWYMWYPSKSGVGYECFSYQASPILYIRDFHVGMYMTWIMNGKGVWYFIVDKWCSKYPFEWHVCSQRRETVMPFAAHNSTMSYQMSTNWLSILIFPCLKLMFLQFVLV